MSSVSDPVASLPSPPPRPDTPARIRVVDLDMAYGDFVIQRNLSFEVRSGEVCVIMGGSGCGKSTLLRHLIGLKAPARGDVLHDGRSLWQANPGEREEMMRQVGVVYQSNALWSSLTLSENVALLMEEFTDLNEREIRDAAALKLALVGLAGFEDFYPSEVSGGMEKRAALARALALDPEILFLDEPSTGLDPISARLLDDLILDLRDGLGTTVVVVTHDLASIQAIGDNAVFLDPEAKTMTAQGNPKYLLANPPNDKVKAFLHREPLVPMAHGHAPGSPEAEGTKGAR